MSSHSNSKIPSIVDKILLSCAIIIILCFFTQQTLAETTFTLKSNPTGALIYIENVEIGTTPYPFQLDKMKPGIYRLTLKKPPRYIDATYELVIKKDMDRYEDTVNLPEIHLPIPPTLFNVDTDPPGATIILDQKEKIGSTNLSTEISPGTHEIRIVLERYQEEIVDFDVQSGRSVSIFRKLHKLPEINIKTKPEDANISIDGNYVGKSPKNVSVSVGSHILIIAKQGFIPKKENITLGLDEIVNEEIELVKKANSIIFIIIDQLRYLRIYLFIIILQLIVLFALSNMVIPKRFGKYLLLKEVGRSKTTVVYKALDMRNSRIVALKRPVKGKEEEEEFLVLFQHQSDLWNQLHNTNQTIVEIYGYGNVNGIPYVAMEYMAKGNLRSKMKKGSIHVHEAIKYTISVCEGLEYIHSKDVYHCDIKPENILFSKKGKIKLGDFGSAVKIDRQFNDTKLITPAYACPDITPGATSDLYSLGVVFYEMLNGRLPFVSNDPRDLIIKHKNETPPKMNTDIPNILSVIVFRMMEKNPESRYQSAKDLQEALEDQQKKW